MKSCLDNMLESGTLQYISITTVTLSYINMEDKQPEAFDYDIYMHAVIIRNDNLFNSIVTFTHLFRVVSTVTSDHL